MNIVAWFIGGEESALAFRFRFGGGLWPIDTAVSARYRSCGLQCALWNIGKMKDMCVTETFRIKQDTSYATEGRNRGKLNSMRQGSFLAVLNKRGVNVYYS